MALLKKKYRIVTPKRTFMLEVKVEGKNGLMPM
jgi:hypothetical protein